MKKTLKKPLIIFFLAISIAGLCWFFYNSYNESSFASIGSQKEQDTINKKVNEEDLSYSTPVTEILALKVSDNEPILGDANAPVTIIEYASLSCPHCAQFHRYALPAIKSKYIETGKVKFVFRNFPLNQQALVGAMITKCHANSNNNDANKYYDMIKLLLKTQDSWAFSSNFIDKLRAIVKLNGMSNQTFEECLLNKELQESILEKRMEAARSLNIKSTPSFFINKKSLNGFTDGKAIEDAIEEELSS